MTCKNCVHENVCVKHHKNRYPFLEFIYDKESCDDFKDKSRFVELPCKAGDSIYYLYCMRVHRIEVAEANLVGLAVLDQFGTKWYDYWDKWNERYFSGKEEAEKKLEEMKNENNNSDTEI